MEARGEKINASSGLSKEIYSGSEEDEDDDDEDDDARIANSCMREFSHEGLKVRRGPFGLCVGTYGSVERSGELLKPS